MNRLAKIVVSGILLLCSFQSAWAAGGTGASAREVLGNAFPQLKIDSMKMSEIPGVYEVISGQNVFYFFPEKELILLGDLVTKEGRSLTQDRRQSLMAEKFKDLPLEKAVKIGTGKHQVIEFTDPDCPYCRRASGALKGRTDMTRYVFFAPLAHPNALPKIHHILHAKDKSKAYEAMMGGAEVPKPVPAEYPEEIKRLASEHMDLARKVGVTGTPTFYLNGTLVVGADMQKIDSLLKEAESAPKAP